VLVSAGSGYTIEKTLVNPRPPLVGDAVSFAIAIINTGSVSLATVPVQDLYSTNSLAFTGATPPTVDTVNDGVLDWLNVGPLAGGASTTLVVNFTAVGGTTGQVMNLAVASPTTTNGPAMPVETNGVSYSVALPVCIPNEAGSLLVFPLIDNIGAQTIIEIVNRGNEDVWLEGIMVVSPTGVQGTFIKQDFMIHLTAKEPFLLEYEQGLQPEGR